MSDANQPSDANRDTRNYIPPKVVIGIGSVRHTKDIRWGLFWGVLITLFGLVVLLDNMGVVDANKIYHFWPLLLIGFGLLSLLVNPTRSSQFRGGVLIFFGVLLQLNAMGIAHFTWGMLWGFFWIAIGLLVLWGSYTARTGRIGILHDDTDPRTQIVENVVFGGIERRLTTQDFRGGVVTAIFGGVELDLSEANMQQEEARLEVNAIFGGIELRVPYNWQVAARGVPIFGGFVDKTRLGAGPDPNTPHKLLVLTGSAIFGGVDVKN